MQTIGTKGGPLPHSTIIIIIYIIYIVIIIIIVQVWGKTGAKLYGQKSGSDFVDNQRRFLLFSKAALCALHMLPFSPGTESVVVCNDWHTAMLPVLLKVHWHSLPLTSEPAEMQCPLTTAFDAVSVASTSQDLYQPRGQYLDTKVALCVHNIAYQARLLIQSLLVFLPRIPGNFQCAEPAKTVLITQPDLT